MNEPNFPHLHKEIVADFAQHYKENATASGKYESFQIAMFSRITQYLHISGDKQNAVKDVFKNCNVERVFPAVYHAVMDSCHWLIVEMLEEKTNNVEHKELVEEEESELYRMHGWVLYELLKKSQFKEIVKTFKLDDKSVLPHSLRLRDVGTKTGLTFPKTIFMAFMKSSDRFIRQSTTDAQYEIYGQNIVKVAKTLTLSNLELQGEFYSAVRVCCSSCDRLTSDQIFNEWMEKFLNMKMKGRFVDAAERLDSAASKKLTTKTQNLRDKLLTHHVQE